MSLEERIYNLKVEGEKWREKQQNKATTVTPVTPLASRLASLSTSQETWKSRTPPKDAKKTELNQKNPPKLFKIKKAQNFDLTPDDYETFGKFFSTNSNGEKIAIDENSFEQLTKIERNSLPEFLFEKPKKIQPKKRGKIIEKVRESVGISEDAKKGLESVEDFSSVKLKKFEEVVFEGVKLFCVKGCGVFEGVRLNLCDSFVFVKGKAAHIYHGPYSNLMKRTKADLFARSLQKHREFGVEKISVEKTEIENFAEAENYEINPEINLEETEIRVKVSKFDKENFQEFQEFEMRMEFLNKFVFEILKFEFENGENYVWCGKKSSKEKLNPPKINQNMEPSIFKFKFSDWAEKIVEKKSFSKNFEELRALDFEKIYESEEIEPDLILENFNLRRLGEFHCDETLRNILITTTTLEKYWITPDSIEKCDNVSIFHGNACYVIYWVYSVSYLTRSLGGGNESRVPLRKGRDRIAWFFWYGKNIGKIERGKICTLFANFFVCENFEGREDFLELVRKIKETGGRGVQIPLESGLEPPGFYALFNGTFQQLQIPSEEKLLIVLGPPSHPLETRFIQITNTKHYSLRKSAVYILLKNNEYAIFKENHSKFHLEAAEAFLAKNNYQENQNLAQNFCKISKFPSDKIKSAVRFEISKENELKGKKLSFSSDNNFPLTQKDLENTATFLETENGDFFLIWEEKNKRFNGFRRAVIKSLERFENARIFDFSATGEVFRNLFFEWEEPEGEEQPTTPTIGKDLQILRDFEERKLSVCESDRVARIYLDWNRIEDYLPDSDFTKYTKLSRQEYEKLPNWRKLLIKKNLSDEILSTQ